MNARDFADSREIDDPTDAIYVYTRRILAAYADFRAGNGTRAEVRAAMAASITNPPAVGEAKRPQPPGTKQYWADVRAGLRPPPQRKAKPLAIGSAKTKIAKALPPEAMAELNTLALNHGLTPDAMAVRLVMDALGYVYVPPCKGGFVKKSENSSSGTWITVTPTTSAR